MDSMIVQLLDLVFFLFDKQSNMIVLIPFAVLYFCFTLALIRVLIRRF